MLSVTRRIGIGVAVHPGHTRSRTGADSRITSARRTRSRGGSAAGS